MAEEKVTVKWACPDCGADANEHGKGGAAKYIQRSPGGCSGFICDCDPEINERDGEEHGTVFDRPCETANCYHCGWGGTFPILPKKLQAWEKQALKAGWAPPAKRKKELGL